jgi:hypothetical protein
VDLASPGVARLLDPDMFPTTSTQISQIESFRLSTSNDRVAVRANVAGSRGGMTIDGSTGQVRYGYLSSTPDMGYAISPDGTMSIFAGQAARAVPWADPAGEFDFGGVLNTGYYFNGAYAPDGSAVAFVRYQTNRELYAYNPRPNNGSARWQMVALSKVPSNTRGVSQYQFAAAQPY